MYFFLSRSGISDLSKEPKIEYERRIKGQWCSQDTTKFHLKQEGKEPNQKKTEDIDDFTDDGL